MDRYQGNKQFTQVEDMDFTEILRNPESKVEVIMTIQDYSTRRQTAKSKSRGTKGYRLDKYAGKWIELESEYHDNGLSFMVEKYGSDGHYIANAINHAYRVAEAINADETSSDATGYQIEAMNKVWEKQKNTVIQILKEWNA